jgi:hypothetical protein
LLGCGQRCLCRFGGTGHKEIFLRGG